MKRISALFLAALLCTSGLYAQKIDTTWAGNLNIMGNTINLYFTLKNDGNGVINTGYLSVPDQGLRMIPLDTVRYESQVLQIVHNALGMRYRGVYALGGFLGDFQQNGLSAPLTLHIGNVPIPKRPQEPKRPFPYREEEVVIHNTAADVDLAGTFTLPQGDGPFPAVVLVTGSGAQNRDEEIFDHKPFLVFSDYLTRCGIAVLRYDDRGVGKSTGRRYGCTTQDFADDAAAAVSYLRTRSEVSRLGVCGHSEGGTIAFILGANDPQVDFVVSLAGTAVRGDKVLLAQQTALGKASRLPDSYLSRIEKINSGLYEIVLASDKPDSTLRADILKYVSETPGATAGADSAGSVADQVMDPWFYYFLRFDPSGDIAKVKVPILALNGTNDLQVIASQNLPSILKNADIAGNKNVTVKYLNSLNHLFQHSKSGAVSEYMNIEETFSEEAMKIVADWINSLQ